MKFYKSADVILYFILALSAALVLYSYFYPSPEPDGSPLISFSLPDSEGCITDQITFVDSGKPINLSSVIQFLRDPNGELSFEDILNEEYLNLSDDFRFIQIPPGEQQYNLEYNEKACWVKLEVCEVFEEQDLLLNASLSSMIVEFYLPRSDGSYEKILRSTAADHNWLYWEEKSYVSFPFSHHAPQTVYIRLSSRYNTRIRVEFFLNSIQSYLNVNARQYLGQAVYLGTLGMIVLFHFFLFLSTKERNYLFYSAFVFFLLLTRLINSRFFIWHVWHDVYIIRRIMYVIAFFSAVVAGVIFIRKSLLPYRLSWKSRFWLDKVSICFLVFVVAAMVPVSAHYFPYSVMSPITTFIGTSGLLLGIGYIIFALKRRIRAAVFYLIAFIPLIIFGQVHSLFRGLFDGVQNMMPYLSILHLSDVFQCTILTFALGSRINEMKSRKEEADRIIINNIKRHKNILLEEKKQLEERIAQRTKELESALFDAEAANIAKSRFLANISHELRTPLGGLIGFAEMMAKTNDEKERKEFGQKIVSESERLLMIISDILDYSKIETGKAAVEISEFSLPKLVEQSLEGARLHAAGKGLDFSIRIDDTIPSVIEGDPYKYRQILLNLVDNSVKFTEQGNIKVSVTVVDSGEGDVFEDAVSEVALVRTTVEDTGVGIEKDRQPYIFDSFTQAESGTARKYGGTGLGMSICRGLVDILGGSISFFSEPGRGSAFSFDLPFQVAKAASSSLSATTHDDGRDGENVVFEENQIDGAGKTVLVVDDYQSNREILSHYLSDFGFSVQQAVHGLDAVKKCQEATYFCIFMDLQMPILDGYNASLRIRNMESNNADIPIIGMTAGGFHDEISKCQEYGMTNCIFKPFRREKLKTVLRELTEEPVDGSLQKIDEADNFENSEGIFDKHRFLLEIGNDLAADELLMGFISSANTLIREIRGAIREHHFSVVHRNAHSVKGGALNVFAPALAKAARELEQYCKFRKNEFDEAEAKQLFLTLQLEYADFVAAVNNSWVY